jgi:hypothetical protein
MDTSVLGAQRTGIADTWRAPAAAPRWFSGLIDWLHPSFASTAFAAMWIAAGLARFGLVTNGFRLRLSEAIGLLIVGAILVASRFRVSIPWRGAVYLLIYVGMEALSTVLNPADWSRGFKLDLLLGVEAILAIAAATLVSSVDRRTLARIIVGAGALAACMAIALTVLYQLHLTSLGVQIDPVTGVCKTYGTMYEANLLGSYLAATLVFSLVAGQFLGPGWFTAASRALMVAGIGLTVSRAIWFSVLAGAVLLLGLAVMERIRLRKQQVAMLASGAALTLLTWGVIVQVASSHPCGTVRASELSTEGSINGRLASHVLALNEWSSSPVWGLGTGSSRAHLPNDPNQPWISSQAIAALHDTGVLGFVLVFGLAALLLWALVRWRRPPDAGERWFGYGLAAAIVTLLAAFQATTGVLMEFPWLFLGTAIGVLFLRPPAPRPAREVAARSA